MLIKLGCVAEITVASFLILLGYCHLAIMTTIMHRETVIIQFHQSQNHSVLNNTEQYSTSKAKSSSANKLKITPSVYDRGYGSSQKGLTMWRNRSSYHGCLWTQVTNSSHYNTTSSLQKITQLTYKTFNCNELLKWSRCCKLNTFALFQLLRKNLLFFVSMYALTPILLPLCVHSVEGDSSHTQISPWGMRKWQRCMPRPLLLSGPWKEKHWHHWQGKCDIFCTVIPHIFKLMPCLK